MRIGAHISIAKGLDYLVERQEEIGGSCGQMFVGSPRTWAVSSFEESDGERFLGLREEADQHPYAAHATYLINLASPKRDLRDKSVECLQAEIDAAARLHVEYVVVHPGAHTGSGREVGIDQISESLNRVTVAPEVTLLLENTAGSGTTLGSAFHELREMMDAADLPRRRLGVCLDTCHAHAAGYELSDNEGFAETLKVLDAELGFDAVQMLHLNDSKDERGSCRDHHEHIGEGHIGDAGFRNVINAGPFAELPMCIETPKDDKESDPRNIARLESLRET